MPEPGAFQGGDLRQPDVADGQRATPAVPVVAAPAGVRWHLAEVAAAVRGHPVPLDPTLLVVVLRGLAELCRLVQARGHEAGGQPPVLLRDNPVIAEALGAWATRLACLARQQQRTAGVEGSRRP